MTPEQDAIQKFIGQGPRPGVACCCMGPLRVKEVDQKPYRISFNYNAEDRLGLIIALRKILKLSIGQTIEIANSGILEVSEGWEAKKIISELKKADFPTKLEIGPSGYAPKCPCMMWNIIPIDGNYYEVTLNGAKYHARYIGPIGGPYLQ